MSVNNRKDLLKNKGRMFVFDEAAAVKAWKELTLVDNVKGTVISSVSVDVSTGITMSRYAARASMRRTLRLYAGIVYTFTVSM